MRASDALAEHRGARGRQPGRGQRADHPPHAHRRAAGRRRRRRSAWPTKPRCCCSASSQRRSASWPRRRPSWRGACTTGATTASPTTAPMQLGAGPAGGRAALRPPARRQRPVADLPRRHLAALAPRRIADAGHARPLLGQPRARDPQSAGGDQLRDAVAGGIAATCPTPTAACWRSSTSRRSA